MLGGMTQDTQHLCEDGCPSAVGNKTPQTSVRQPLPLSDLPTCLCNPTLCGTRPLVVIFSFLEDICTV